MKKVVMALSLTLITFVASAQTNSNRDVVRGPYLTNGFYDNWFFQFGAGASVYLGGQNENSFSSRMAPTVDLGIGKWITPTVGVRLQGNFSPSMSQFSNTYTSPFIAGESNGFVKQQFNFISMHSDFMINPIVMIHGYKENRFYEVIPYLGLGWGGVFSGKIRSQDFTANLGVINKFRISRVIDLNLELRSAMAKGSFDRSSIRNFMDIPVALTAGVTIRLGKAQTFKRAASADYSSYIEQVRTLENNNKMLNDELSMLRNRKPETITKNVEIVGKTIIKPSPVALFFELGKFSLDNKELTNLDFYVQNAIKADPNKVFTLVGSADKATGTAAVNQKLSEQRVQYVYDLLINKYKIPANRLIKKAVGDTENRFDEAALNRATFIIE